MKHTNFKKNLLLISLCCVTSAMTLTSHSSTTLTSTPIQTEATKPNHIDHSKAAPIQELTDKLLKKLHSNPKDMKGWVLLAKSYTYLNQNDNAEMAFNKAKALGYQGQSPLKSQTISSNYDSSYSFSNIANSIAIVDSEQVETSKLLVKNSQPSQMSETTEKNSLTVSLKIAKVDQSKVPNEATVFIFARKTEGPPMPLAVVKKSVSDLPITLTLDESMAMMPTHSLSTVDKAIVVARISLSGNATKSPGDWEVISSPIQLEGGNSKVELILSAP